MGAGAEAKFAKQVAKGVAFWRQQRLVALAASILLVGGSAYQLLRAWREPAADPMLDVFRILTLVGFAVAAAMWHVHAELMLGAAGAAARQEAAKQP